MRIRFRSVWWRLGIAGVVVLTLGLTACAAPAATPMIASPVANAMEIAQNEYQTQVTLMSPVIPGSNPITVQVRNIQTGKPLHDATVRVAVAANQRASIAKDDHTKTTSSSHGSTPETHSAVKKDDHANEQKDTHATAQVASHANEKNVTHQAEAKNASHADEDAAHAGKPMTAGKTEGEYVGQVMFPNAGEWLLTVSYEIEGKEQTALFAVNAARSAETWLVLSGFLGVNLAVIATAGITKRKASKK
ncbi:MAG: hypothetical protein HY868_17270 [Chloroflexi bacterium]|nr:hypothetical protein [Chloroflexota bacterium]